MPDARFRSAGFGEEVSVEAEAVDDDHDVGRGNPVMVEVDHAPGPLQADLDL